MLKYLVQITGDLTVTGLIFGMLLAFLTYNFGKKGRNIFIIAGGASFVSAAVISILKNTNRNIKTTQWNQFTLILTAVLLFAFVLFTVFSVNPLRKKLKKAGEYVYCIASGLVMLPIVSNTLPDVLAYPANFDLQGKSIVSTEFLYRLIGWVLGLILIIVMGIAAYKTLKQLSTKVSKIVIIGSAGVFTFGLICRSIQIMVTRRMIASNDFFFEIIKFRVNYEEYFTFAVALLALIAAIYKITRNIRVTEEYSNPAQLRKIKAEMRRHRRWAVTLIVCIALAVFNLTAVDAYNNRPPVEAPVEECLIENGNAYVDFEQVSDGHLHRFGYTTDDEIQARFIIIKKPNSSAYGVGLDACDICGEAGYFERDGQVVCKKCDVVMNINTIGFKGGCNPIVIDYTVENGQIIVPLSELIKYQNKFK